MCDHPSPTVWPMQWNLSRPPLPTRPPAPRAAAVAHAALSRTLPLSALQNFTQYIPLSLHELHSWAGSPTILVFDCPAAGEVINAFAQIRAHGSRVCSRPLRSLRSL